MASGKNNCGIKSGSIEALNHLVTKMIISRNMEIANSHRVMLCIVSDLEQELEVS